MKQGTLFGDMAEETVSLKILTKTQKALSKDQQTFNRLSKRIETLEREIVSENEKLTKLVSLYAKELKPLVIEKANNQVKLAMTLGDASKSITLGMIQIEKVRTVIMSLCSMAFREIEPTAEVEAFYDQWANASYKEELQEQKQEAKEFFSDFINSTLGLDIDFSDLEDSPEGFTKFKEKLKDELERGKKGRKKTKRQLQKEEKVRCEEEIKKKSIRNVYIALSKLLHPDTEIDPVLKKRKEEIMKKVTTAYKQKDLTTLLKLEIEWVHKENEHLEKLTEENLKVYILALKEQVAELEMQRNSIYGHPRLEGILEFARYPEIVAKALIARKAGEVRKNNEVLSSDIAKLKKSTPKKRITNFVNEFLQKRNDFDSSILDTVLGMSMPLGKFGRRRNSYEY